MMCEWHGLQYLQIQRYFSFWGKLSLSNTQTREKSPSMKTSHISQEWGNSPSLNRRQITVCLPTGEFVNLRCTVSRGRTHRQNVKRSDRSGWEGQETGRPWHFSTLFFTDRFAGIHLIRSSFKVLPKHFSLTEVWTLWSTDNTWTWNWLIFISSNMALCAMLQCLLNMNLLIEACWVRDDAFRFEISLD